METANDTQLTLERYQKALEVIATRCVAGGSLIGLEKCEPCQHKGTCTVFIAIEALDN